MSEDDLIGEPCATCAHYQDERYQYNISGVRECNMGRTPQFAFRRSFDCADHLGSGSAVYELARLKRGLGKLKMNMDLASGHVGGTIHDPHIPESRMPAAIKKERKRNAKKATRS